MSGENGAPRRGRALGGICVALTAAAGLLWGASALAWAPTGRAAAGAAAGSTAPSALTGVALLALAGVAGVVATTGVPRRIVGGLLGLAGAAVVVAAVAAVAGATVRTGPLLAVGGGLLLAVVGGVVALREPRLARLGARYAAAGSRSAPPDPDRAAWAALDEGRDPTADPLTGPVGDRAGDAAVKPDDPGGGRGGGAV